jgi:transposase
VHPRKAKLMMGSINKSDKLDVHGLNLLQRSGTLPTVWIAPRELRDLRELTRVRMVLANQRTRLKNRLASMLAKYALASEDAGSDAFAPPHRTVLSDLLTKLPKQTQFAAQLLLEQLDFVTGQIERQEQRLKEVLKVTPSMQLLDTLPGVGLVLASVLALEIGDVGRFPSAEHLAGYAGTTPRLHASGGKVRHGQLRSDVNRYLKWALTEAANVVAINHKRWPHRHVAHLYARLRERKDHYKAIGAVARHLAESAYHVLSRNEPYREPAKKACGKRVAEEGVSAKGS